jgi:hypothetical protein
LGFKPTDIETAMEAVDANGDPDPTMMILLEKAADDRVAQKKLLMDRRPESHKNKMLFYTSGR